MRCDPLSATGFGTARAPGDRRRGCTVGSRRAQRRILCVGVGVAVTWLGSGRCCYDIVVEEEKEASEILIWVRLWISVGSV